MHLGSSHRATILKLLFNLLRCLQFPVLMLVMQQHWALQNSLTGLYWQTSSNHRM
nr:hypothetical protein Iba_chr05cCG16350 [Ipomoea batatas]GMD01859.1 hypothetical protein Iba_chr05fCG11110 [Ipomoea batatas]GMD41168.1 hypothetical protein Iba_chr10aCG16450 [Ipomoea batatas]